MNFTNDSIYYIQYLLYDDGYYYQGEIENLKKPWTQEPHFLPLVIIYGVVFLFGIVGNSLVIVSVLGGRTSRSVTFAFMVSLAMADILFLLVCVPHETLRMILGHWSGGQTFCKISGFVEMLTAVSSITNLAAVSLERYFVIVMPMRSRAKCTMGNTRKVLILVWLVAIVLSAPALYVKDTQSTKYYKNGTTVIVSFCADHGLSDEQQLGFYIYQFLIMFAIPTVLMVYCYAVVIYVLWISGQTLLNLTANNTTKCLLSSRSNNNQTSSSVSNEVQRTFRQRKLLPVERRNAVLKGRKQVIKMLITVVLLFLLCWGPKLILQMLKKIETINLFSPEMFKLQIAILCLPYIQSCINPFIYGFMSKNFRRSLVTSCHKHVCPSSKHCLQWKKSPDYDMDSKCLNSNGTFQTRFAIQCSDSVTSSGILYRNNLLNTEPAELTNLR